MTTQPAQGMEARSAETEGLSPKDDSPTRRDAPPSLPPTGEGLPEEIVKAIDFLEDEVDDRARGAINVASEARSTLDATILHHLSAARARAERAEKALEAAGQAADAMESVSKRLPAYSSPAELLFLHALKVRAALSSVAEEA